MDLIIFDLDGTLIDSRLDLALAVNAMRTHLGLDALDVDLVASYVGDGAPVLMRRSLGPEASEETVRRALEFFLGYYRQHALDNTRAYPGIPEALDALERGGMTMAVLTNKPTAVSVKILEGLGLARYFARIHGGDSFERKKPDPMGVHSLLAEFGVDAERAILVGDSGVDARTARNAGIRVCGVRYGLQPEALEQERPDMMVDRAEQLAPAIMEQISRGTTKS